MELIQIDPKDSVAVALADLKAEQVCTIQGKQLRLRDDVSFGHKVALCRIAQGENVIKYGSVIGHATQKIEAGEHVHVHNLRTNLSGIIDYTYQKNLPVIQKRKPANFNGYVRKNGRVGIRNELWIIPTVGCVNTTAAKIAAIAKERYGSSVDDICAFTHNMGCSQLGEDQSRTMQILSGLIQNPNAGGVLVLSLGCENNNLEVFAPYLKSCDSERIRFLVTQDVEDEISAAIEIIDELIQKMETDKRESVSMEHLVIGFKCGGSDAFSGITANALCGRITDYLTVCGGTSILTEVPEMFGAEEQLMARATDNQTFEDVVSMINCFKRYFSRYDQPIYENPSPGNKKGGISTMEEKSLGCIQKGGKAVVTDVLEYGEMVKEPGLNLLIGPGNDQVSCTNLTASGANIIIFTTGRGNPYGAPVPTIKLSSNSRLAAKKANWIDYNAGSLIENATFEEMAEDFMQYILSVASGDTKTNNEKNGYKEISIFRDGVIL